MCVCVYTHTYIGVGVCVFTHTISGIVYIVYTLTVYTYTHYIDIDMCVYERERKRFIINIFQQCVGEQEQFLTYF